MASSLYLLLSCPLHLSISSKLSSSFSSSINGRNPFVVLSSSITNANEVSTSEEKKRLLLELYGLDPSEFTLHPPQRSRRTREEPMKLRKKGKGRRWMEESPPAEEKKAVRTTHKLLKVLGGKACRKKLLSPKGMDVRPMMEVVRGAAFDILQVADGCPASLRPGRWLDLYSGTGSVGIEAISRGCSEAHFVEMDPWVVKEVLTPNLEWTGFLDVSVIHRTRVEEFLKQAAESQGNLQESGDKKAYFRSGIPKA